MKNMKDLKCCFGFLFEKYEKISKLEVLIGAQIVGTSAVVDLWVRRTMDCRVIPYRLENLSLLLHTSETRSLPGVATKRSTAYIHHTLRKP